MGLFDIFKIKWNDEDKLLKEMYSQIFPGGKSEVDSDVDQLRQVTNYKYSRKDLLNTYTHAISIYYVASDKSEQRIITSILNRPNSEVTKSDAKHIFQFIHQKIKNRSRKMSLLLISDQYRCSPLKVKDTFIKKLKDEYFNATTLKQAMEHWHTKRDEEAKALGLPIDDTPAAIMEEWTSEVYEEQLDNEKYGGGGLHSSPEFNWPALLANDNIPDQLIDVVNLFFIPYGIDATTYYLHQDASEDPYRYKMYQNEPLFSSNLLTFLEDPSKRAVGYPDWFYLAFPDVAMWAVHGAGKDFLNQLFNNVQESEAIDASTSTLKHHWLKKIIDRYLQQGHSLDCKLKTRNNLSDSETDDLPF